MMKTPPYARPKSPFRLPTFSVALLACRSLQGRLLSYQPISSAGLMKRGDCGCNEGVHWALPLQCGGRAGMEGRVTGGDHGMPGVGCKHPFTQARGAV